MIKSKVDMKYTLVQHSGYGYAGKGGFRSAVEVGGPLTEAEMKRVRKAGGTIYNSYVAASDVAERENYPPDVTGLYPRVKGTFSTKKVDGLCIYIAPPKTKSKAA